MLVVVSKYPTWFENWNFFSWCNEYFSHSDVIMADKEKLELFRKVGKKFFNPFIVILFFLLCWDFIALNVLCKNDATESQEQTYRDFICKPKSKELITRSIYFKSPRFHERLLGFITFSLAGLYIRLVAPLKNN